jgi:hypothetical protein
VGEHLEVFGSTGQLEHSERSTDVAIDSVIDSGIEVDTCGTVDDYLTSARDFFLVLRRET